MTDTCSPSSDTRRKLSILEKIEVWVNREIDDEHDRSRKDDRPHEPRSARSEVVVNKEHLRYEAKKIGT